MKSMKIGILALFSLFLAHQAQAASLTHGGSVTNAPAWRDPSGLGVQGVVLMDLSGNPVSPTTIAGTPVPTAVPLATPGTTPVSPAAGWADQARQEQQRLLLVTVATAVVAVQTQVAGVNASQIVAGALPASSTARTLNQTPVAINLSFTAGANSPTTVFIGTTPSAGSILYAFNQSGTTAPVNDSFYWLMTNGTTPLTPLLAKPGTVMWLKAPTGTYDCHLELWQ